MNTIQVDAATAERLRNAAAGTRVVGPDGQSLAAVLSPDLFDSLEWLIETRRKIRADAETEDTLEELRAIEAAGGEIPHDEVMKRLGLG